MHYGSNQKSMPHTENLPMHSLIARFMGPIWGRQDPGGPHELCYLGWHLRDVVIISKVYLHEEHLLWINSLSHSDVTVTWRHQAITWTNVDLLSKLFCGLHLRAVSQDLLMNLIRHMFLETALLKLLPHLPAAIELKFMGTYFEIALRWMPQNTFDNKSTLVLTGKDLVLTSHHLSQ